MIQTLSASPCRHFKLPSARFFRRAFTILALACGLLAPAAHAANITRTYNFVASGFTYGPESSVTGSFTVTFDPAVSVTNQAAGITVHNMSIPYQGAALFSYYANTGYLVIGANSDAFNISSGFAGDTSHPNDFILQIQSASTTATFYYLTYKRLGYDVRPATFTGTVTLRDTISGGWVNSGNFSIGTTGTNNDTNNWPSSESPWQAADGDVNTKFLIFKGSNAGMVITPPTPATYNRLALTTAGDAPERDPASYIIYGSSTALPTSGNIPISGLTLIQQGTLALTDARNSGPALVQFTNATAYASYLVVFPTVKNSPATTLTQIAEVKLSQGMTVTNQVPVGKVRGGQLSSNSFTLGTVATNWPAGESPDHALDGSASSKFLFTQNNGAGLIVAPEAGPTVINSLSFWTAGDAPERDPLTYKVYGSTSAATGHSGTHGVGGSPWTLIKDTTPVTLPTERGTGPTTVNFTNTTAYTSYLVVFPTVKNTSGNTLTQIADVAFANVPQNAAPTNITLSATHILENNAAGATIGTLTATDPDAAQTHSFSFTGGSSYPDNDAFTITGNTLTINASADFETKNSYTILIRATDNGSPAQSFEKEFTITIGNRTFFQSITFGSLINKTFGDAPFPVSATGGESGQPVTFSIFSGPATISGSTVTITGAGTVTIRASQAGFGDYIAAPPRDQSFTVEKAPQTITFNPATTALTTDTVTLSATGGGSGLPVTFAITNDGPGSITGNQLTFTGPGPVIVQASQAGNVNYLAATPVSRTITVSDPVTFPVVTSPTSVDITATSATLGGNVTSDGGSPITERGIVYALTSTNANPFIGGSGVIKVTASGTTGVFTVPVTGLTPNNGYSFKAYAISAGGELLGYTPVATFTSGYANTAPSFALPAQGPTGEVWTKRETVRDWAAVACSADANKITALVQNGTAYTSPDFGVTWTAQPGSGSRAWSAIASSADGSKLAATTTGGFIYTSIDSGVTWTERTTSGSRNWYRIASSTDGSRLAAIVTGTSGTRSIFTSADSGATWSERTAAGSREWKGIASSADGTKLAAAAGSSSGKIYTSTDSGATWTERTAAGSKDWYGIASSADGTILTAMGSGAPVSYTNRSLDGGATWAPGYSNPAVNFLTSRQTSIAVSADASKLAMGGSAYLVTSNDGGASIAFQEGQRNWTAIAMSADGTRIVASALNAPILTSTLTPPQIRVLPGSGVSTTAGFASAISPGPVADAGQTVSFQVTTPDTALFTTPPAISPTGTLTFTAGTAYGVATVTVRALDTGGTASGGQDTSAPQTFTVMVAPEPGMTVDIVFDPATGKTRVNYSGNWGIRAGRVAGDSTDLSQYQANYGPTWHGRFVDVSDIHNITTATPEADILVYGDDSSSNTVQSGTFPPFSSQFFATAWGGDFWGYDSIGIFGPEAAFTPTGRISGYLEFDKTLTELGLTSGDSGIGTFTPNIPAPVWPAGVATMSWSVRTLPPLPTIVTNTLNTGVGSLRQAVLNANANPGADTITFDPTVFATAQTIVLASSNFAPFTGDTTVTGPAAGVTVQAVSVAGGVFTVGTGTTASFSKLTIAGGLTGILNHGTLTASNCGFFQTTLGINNVNTATVTGCSFVENSVAISNGVNPVNAAAMLIVSDCSFTDFQGMAIRNNGTATMNGCTTDNSAFSGDFTLFNQSGATLTLTNCSLLDSSGNGYSFINEGNLTFQNCTVVELTFTGVTYNSGTLTLKNTIFLKQPGSGTVDGSNPFIDGGGNLILNRTGDLAADLTTLGLDPTGLQNNGGPTKTIKLLGGAAINGGLAANVPVGVTTDQRGSGFARSVGTVDIGAYEHPSPVQLVATTASAAEGTGAVTTAFTFTVSRPGATTDAVTVNYAVTGTGTNPADAADFGGTLPSGTLTLPIGVASDIITIAVSKDALVETDETFTLTLSNPTANHAIAGNGAVATIANDDFNASPTFSGYAFSTPKNTAATVAVAKILARAADTDGGTLALTAVSAASAQGGSVSLSSGNVTYTPANNYTGLDTFTVTISDGQGGSVIGTVTVNITDGSGAGKNQAKITVLPDGNVALLFQGIPGQAYEIQRSTDLVIWTTATTVTAAADGTIPYTDTNPPSGGSAYYRTAVPQG